MKKTSKLNQGFTLIELVVVLSVIAILSTVGIAAFVSYSRTQTLNTAVLDLVSMLNVAKSRSMSQVKPAGVTCAKLDGYKMTICRGGCTESNQTYEFRVICQGNESNSLETKSLPKGINFDSSRETSFFFPVLTGGVDGATAIGTTITLNGYGDQTKTITIYSDGRIITN